MKRTQQGMTIWGWLMVLGLIGFFSILTMKLLPIYMENMSVKKAVKIAASEPGADKSKVNQIYNKMSKQLYIDNVNSVKESDLDIALNEDGSKTLIVNYEVRVPIMFNVDAVVWFEEKRELGATE